MKDVLKILKEATDAIHYLGTAEGKKFTDDLNIKYFAVLNHRIAKLSDEIELSKVNIANDFAKRAQIVDEQPLTSNQVKMMLALEEKVKVKQHSYSNYDFKEITLDLMIHLQNNIDTFKKIVQYEKENGLSEYFPTHNKKMIIELKKLYKILSKHQKDYYYYSDAFNENISFIKKTDLPVDL